MMMEYRSRSYSATQHSSTDGQQVTYSSSACARVLLITAAAASHILVNSDHHHHKSAAFDYFYNSSSCLFDEIDETHCMIEMFNNSLNSHVRPSSQVVKLLLSIICSATPLCSFFCITNID
jgi:hypothetical protein